MSFVLEIYPTAAEAALPHLQLLFLSVYKAVAGKEGSFARSVSLPSTANAAFIALEIISGGTAKIGTSATLEGEEVLL